MESKEIVMGLSEQTISDFKKEYDVRLSKQLRKYDLQDVLYIAKKSTKQRVFDKELLSNIVNTIFYGMKYKVYLAYYGNMQYTTTLYCTVNNDRTITMNDTEELDLTPRSSTWAIPVVIIDTGRTKKFIECWKWEDIK